MLGYVIFGSPFQSNNKFTTLYRSVSLIISFFSLISFFFILSKTFSVLFCSTFQNSHVHNFFKGHNKSVDILNKSAYDFFLPCYNASNTAAHPGYLTVDDVSKNPLLWYYKDSICLKLMLVGTSLSRSCLRNS